MKNIFFLFVYSFITIFSFKVFPQSIKLADFENLDGWQKIASDGASINVSFVPGVNGKAIKIDYKFTGAAYCGIVKKIPMSLPSNYKFNFFIKGNSPKNNLEFKLDDSTGNNVWWHVFRRADFPKDWKEWTVRKRQISFAWGPKGGGDITRLDKLEIIISAAEGGSGTIYIDDLSFTKLQLPKKENIAPAVYATSTLKGKSSFIFDGKDSTYWRSKQNDKQFLIFNFKYLREYGGLIISWDSLDYATDFNIESSNDKNNWEIIYKARNENRIKSFIPLPDNESKYMKIDLLTSSRHNGYAIKEVEIENYKFTEDNNYFFEQVAKHYPEGFYPKYLHNIQTYWDVVGVNGDKKNGLINEEGMIETSKESFSVEPFIYFNNKFITWHNVKTKQSLEDGYLPIPIVDWENKDFLLQVKSLAWGDTGASSIYVKYRITNKSNSVQNGSLYLAIRPFQVSPPWQSLNLKGGVAKIKNIEYKNGVAIVNKNKEIISVTRPSNFGAVKFTNGSIINYIDKNKLPLGKSVSDSLGFASGAIQYNFELKPGAHFNAVITVPFYKKSSHPTANELDQKADLYFSRTLSSVKSYWKQMLNKVQFNLPASAKKLINTLKSNLAYILINRSGNALQPGSRCYARSWIRDGSLMSAALLRMGITKEVKDYINWYSKYQFPSGKIPCVVDRIGADPVPENDSQGEYIFLIKEYFNYTKDTLMLKNKWENVKKTVDYIKYQIGQETTDKNKYGTNEQKSFYGLVPESISHEGYSAKPMHSYWDDFFVLKGLKDAVEIAKILNKKDETAQYIKLRNTFRKNLYNSINLAMKNKDINYIPGCAELGDFDATSTTIAISPCGELNNLPEPALQNTFNKYYDNFKKRLDPDNNWINYTPYEIRVAETFIHLGEKQKTFALLNFFFKDQRPEGWNHWAEVVWKDKNTPKFIGDMPHSWVGSAYINAVRAMFVYENDDSTLTIGAGIKGRWLNSPNGISIKNLPTYFGNLSYAMKFDSNRVKINLTDNFNSYCKKIILKSPLTKELKKVLANGKEIKTYKNNEIYLTKNDKEIIIEY